MAGEILFYPLAVGRPLTWKTVTNPVCHALRDHFSWQESMAAKSVTETSKLLLVYRLSDRLTKTHHQYFTHHWSSTTATTVKDKWYCHDTRIGQAQIQQTLSWSTCNYSHSSDAQVLQPFQWSTSITAIPVKHKYYSYYGWATMKLDVTWYSQNDLRW